MVVAKGEIAAGRGEIRRLQRAAERIRVLDVGLSHRAQQQVRSIEPLTGVKCWDPVIFGGVGFDKGLVGRVVQIARPV